MSKNDLALLVLDSCKEFGEKVEQNLLKIRNETDKKYIARLENIKQQLGTDTMTLTRLQEIDPEFANAYKEFLSRDNENSDNGHYLMRQGNWHNEILVSNPKITAIFTDNIDNLPVEYLQKAQEENLPIVLVK